MDGGGSAPLEGDVALVALLRLHSLAMNGGLAHGLEVLDPTQCVAAIAGFRYFGLEDMAILIEHAMQVSEDELYEYDDQYFSLVPKDDILVEAFLQNFATDPKAFSPVDGDSRV